MPRRKKVNVEPIVDDQLDLVEQETQETDVEVEEEPEVTPEIDFSEHHSFDNPDYEADEWN